MHTSRLLKFHISSTMPARFTSFPYFIALIFSFGAIRCVTLRQQDVSRGESPMWVAQKMRHNDDCKSIRSRDQSRLPDAGN